MTESMNTVRFYLDTRIVHPYFTRNAIGWAIGWPGRGVRWSARWAGWSWSVWGVKI